MIKSEKESIVTPTATIVGMLTLFLLSSLFLLGVFYSLPSNVVSTKDGSPQRVFFTRLIPEAWGFFTKPPDSSEYAVFTVNNESIESALGFPHSKAENWYGILRSHRAQGPEVAELANQTEKAQWLKCDQASVDCVTAATQQSPVQINNTFPTPTLCGPLVIAETAPVEWSYRNSFDGWRQEKSAIYVESNCQ